MFLEDEDWNDDKGDVPSPAVTTQQQETSSPNVKTKVVGKKSLLRTLQTLGSVPEWKGEGREMGSDSETESPTIEHTKKRRKKHRRKRKHSETEEQAESTELKQGDTQDTDPPKKSKKDQLAKKVKSKTTDKTKDLEMEKPGKEPTQASEKKLSRQQWKNRMKNKRKSKNKFRSQEEAPERERKETDHNDNITSPNIPAKEVVKKKDKKEKLKSSEELKQIKAEDEKKTIIEDTGLRKPTTTQKYELNKKAQLRKEKLRKLLQSPETQAEVAQPVEEVDPEKEVEKADTPDASASLRFRMEQRLESARFRFINELLYSSTSKDARRMFNQDPQAFWVYHRGYSTQVQRWPSNPVDSIIQFIKKKPPSLVVADFGCGDCKIAKSVKNKVHSFDLVATCELVTACDMANVPLKDSSVDIAVFCLSLMGTNLVDFLKEANRVLKKGGFLKIAEVSSRFDDVRRFLTALSELGFKLLCKDTENTHFFSFDFVKTGPAPENMKKFGLQLKPCVYKKR